MKTHLGLLVALSVLSSGLLRAETSTKKFDRKTQENNVLFVVDKSGSVAGSELSIYKSSIAGETARSPEKRYGLVYFDGCGASSVVYAVPLSHGTGSKVASVVGGLEGGGATALALALQKSREIMEAEEECIRLVLFTDHMETCGGNVQGTLEGIDAYCMEINVITTKSELELGILGELVKKTGGQMKKVDHTRTSVKGALEDILRGKRKTSKFTTFETEEKKPKKEEKPKEEPKKKEAPKKYEYRTGSGTEKERGSR